MKLALALLIFSQMAFSFVPMEEEVYVLDQNKAFLREIKNHPELIIDHVTSRGYEVYGPKGLKVWLKDIGVKFIDGGIDKSAHQKAETYPSYAQITKKLQELEKKRPDLVKLFSIGKTQQGRELWFVKISDNVDQDETEPEFKYISSMHGDEITGRELMLRLIEDLIDGYGVDEKITSLINATEIYIMPSMNPDGSELRRRGNASGIDLNRAFPDFTTSDSQNQWNGRPLEVQAIMKFQATRHFSLSANFHGGTEVVNYPWDTSADQFPLEKMAIDFSLEYASKVPGMYDSNEFPQGITNGYAWYEVNGGMQDWSYYWYGDLQLTVELSHSKWPSYSMIPGYYQKNKASLIRYIERIHSGAGFHFDYIKNGLVKIYNLDERKLVGTFRFSAQEFYKVLPAGNYSFQVEVDGALKELKFQVQDVGTISNKNFIKL